MSTLWTIGYAEIDISPRPGTQLCGYGFNSSRRSQVVRDPLLARCLFWKTGDTEALVIECDLLSMATRYANEVRAAIAEAAAVPVEHVSIGCIHTHCGPGVGNDEYREDRLLPQLCEGARRARAAAKPGYELTYHTEYIEPIGFNRRAMDFSGIDNRLHTLFLTAPGEPEIVVWNYACHPVVFGPELHLSADFPGEVNRRLREHGRIGIFLQGFAGDIDPVTNLNRWGKGDTADLATLGELVSRRIEKSRRYAKPTGDAVFHASWKYIDLPMEVPASAAEIDAEVERVRHGTTAGAENYDTFLTEWAEIAKQVLPERQARPFVPQQPVMLFRFGSVRLLGLPGEVLTGYGLLFKKLYPGVVTWGLANGHAGYLPLKRDFEDKQDYACYIICKAYAAQRFPYLPTLEDVITNAVAEMFKEVE